MDKPSVYLETSIVSYLAADPSRHPVTLRNQQLTHAWWETRRGEYDLQTSTIVKAEAMQGNPVLAQRRLALLSNLPLLSADEDVHALAEQLRRNVPLPPKADTDALHIALAAGYGVTYVLTWNCKHIANPRLLSRIKRICASHGSEVPRLCTPLELLGE
jgi:predicted nucleic acid-binding protein